MRFLIVISQRLKRALSNKRSFCLTLILPILAVVLGVLANNLSMPQLSIAVTGNLSSDDIAYVSNQLNTVEGITSHYYRQASKTTDLIMGQYDILLELNDTGTIHYTTVRHTKEEQGIYRLLDDFSSPDKPIGPLSQYLEQSPISAIDRILSFMILLLLITCTVNSSMMIRDKYNGIHKRIAFSPYPMTSYILGNIGYSMLLTLAQIVIALVLIYSFGIPTYIPFRYMLYIGLMITLMATAFGTFMAVLFDHELYANLFSSVIALIFSLFGGTFIAYTNMPPTMQHLSIISPTRWVIVMANRLNNGWSLSGQLPYLLLCIAFVVIAFFLSALKASSIGIRSKS